MSFRRTADPVALARSSKMVRAWERRTRELAAGDELADEHWYAYLITISRPIPRVACGQCEDTGIVQLECTINHRCTSRLCEHPDRRSDPDRTHTYVRACSCAAGATYQRSFAAATEGHHEEQPKAAAPKVRYGFRQATR